MSEDATAKIIDEAASEKIRTKLECVFRSVHTVEAVVIVCCEALKANAADCDPEVSTVLMHAASNPLHAVLKELTGIIEALGGKTAYSEVGKDEENQSGG